jgi:ABC-type multidrug transport system ATPase subunit
VLLSGGQWQRVAIARAALRGDADLLVLDEPSAGLDLTARSRFLDTVRRTAAAGAGVLLSSHHLADVEQVCDDVVILHRGRAVAAGPLDELIAAYAEPFVEVSAGGRRRRVPGTDVLSALAGLGDLRDLESVAVRRPSLEAVFVAVTGTRPEPGEEAR